MPGFRRVAAPTTPAAIRRTTNEAPVPAVHARPAGLLLAGVMARLRAVRGYARLPAARRAPGARRLSFLQLLERWQMTDWFFGHLRPIVDSLLYSVLGTLILLASFW